MHRLRKSHGDVVRSRRISSLFFKAVRAGLAVKRRYLDHNGRASPAAVHGGRETEKQPTKTFLEDHENLVYNRI